MCLVAPTVAIKENVELVDWNQVRYVYRKLHTDFHVLTTPFGIRISPQMNRDLALLIASIDAVDRELDELDDLAERDAFSKALVVYLKGESTEIHEPSVSESLATQMRRLRTMIERLNIQAAFVETVERILEHTEGKRQATDDGVMIEHLLAEWRHTGVLPVLVLGRQSTREFEDFFFCCVN